jgi:hypothetical protein
MASPAPLPAAPIKTVGSNDPIWTTAKTVIQIEPKPAAKPPQTMEMSPILPDTRPRPAAVAAAPASPRVVVPVSGSTADDNLLAIERMIRNECRSCATILEVYSPKPGKLTVRLIAQSDATAEEAVRIVSQLPQLKPFAVEFEGKVVGK